MSTPLRYQGTPVTDTRQGAGTHPTPRPPGRPESGHGIISLCLAAASFATAPFLLLVPVAGFIPAILAAAGVVLVWIGLRRGDRRPGLAVAGLIVWAVLFGLTLSIAMLWTRLVVVPAVSDYPELQKAIGHIKLVLRRWRPGGFGASRWRPARGWRAATQAPPELAPVMSRRRQSVSVVERS